MTKGSKAELPVSILSWYRQWRCSALTWQQLHVLTTMCQLPAGTQTLYFSKEGSWGSGSAVSLSFLPELSFAVHLSVHLLGCYLDSAYTADRVAYWWSAGLLVACTHIPDSKYIHTNCGQWKVCSLAGLSCSLADTGIYAKLSRERFFPATACGSLWQAPTNHFVGSC